MHAGKASALVLAGCGVAPRPSPHAARIGRACEVISELERKPTGQGLISWDAVPLVVGYLGTMQNRCFWYLAQFSLEAFFLFSQVVFILNAEPEIW